jgi:hypothetical protein
MENLTAIQKLGALLEYFIKEKSTKVSFSDMTTRFNATPGQIREILDRLLSDGYVREFTHTQPTARGPNEWETYSSTFDGRLFYDNGGYKQESKVTASSNQNEYIRTLILTYGTALAGLYGLFEILKWLFHHEGWHIFF